MADIRLLAGSLSSLMFAIGTLPMVYKAFRTRNLQSYSLGNVILSNLGNLLYWIYIVSLPVGPVWYLHIFNSITTFLMLLLYLRYEKRWRIAKRSKCPGVMLTCFSFSLDRS